MQLTPHNRRCRRRWRRQAAIDWLIGTPFGLCIWYGLLAAAFAFVTYRGWTRAALVALGVPE